MTSSTGEEETTAAIAGNDETSVTGTSTATATPGNTAVNALANDTATNSNSKNHHQNEANNPAATTATTANSTTTTKHNRTPTWDESYQELVAYHNQFGHCNVPSLYPPNKRLGKWTSRQRLAQKNGQLNDRRREKLNAIGFCWDCQAYKAEQQWHQKFAALQQQYNNNNNGNATIPRTTTTTTTTAAAQRELSTWCSKQRHLYKQGQLSHERKTQLDSIGFVWHVNPPLSEEEEQARLEADEMDWMEQYQEYKHNHNNNNNQTQGESSFSLWLTQQHKRYAEGTLLEHRKRLLQDIGVDFSINHNNNSKPSSSSSSVLEEQWKEKLVRLQEYQKQYNTLEVPSSTDKEHLDLHRWIKRQRMLRLQGNLDDSRRERLEAIGFDFKLPDHDATAVGATTAATTTHEDNWEAKYKRLEDYQKHRGHANVTCKDGDPDLYRWVRRQRQLYKDGSLRPERRERLEELGFSWEVVRVPKKPSSKGNKRGKRDGGGDVNDSQAKKNVRFEENLNKLKQYVAENGDANVPRDYKSDPALAHFVANQRKQYKMCKMPQDRIAALESIGFVWTVKEQRSWSDNFKRLKDYKKAKGDSNVPCRWSKDPALGSFVNFQRRKFRDGKLPKEHCELLTSIGFEFEVLPSGAQKRKADRPQLRDKSEVRVSAAKEKKWDEMYDALVNYRKKHGHVNVPLRDKEYSKLGKWISHQRLSCVRIDRREKLDQLGFVWDASALTSKKRQLDEEEKAEAEAAEQKLVEAYATKGEDRSPRRGARGRRNQQQTKTSTSPRKKRRRL